MKYAHGTAEPSLAGGVNVRLDANRCVRAHDRFAACDVCLRECPSQALQLGREPVLDAEACTGCGLCLHNCPTGAFSGDDGVNLLLQSAQQLAAACCIELACHRHPAPAIGPAGVDTVVRVGHCLAAFGPSAYLALLANGTARITVRLDACAACPMGAARTQIEGAFGAANQLARAAGRPGTPVQGLAALSPAENKTRPVMDARPQSLSRRKLFGMLTGESIRLLAGNLVPEQPDQAPASGKDGSARPQPTERRRLLAALKQIAAPGAAIGNTAGAALPSPALPFVQLAASETCTACGLCARVCPTGALRLGTRDDNRYELTFLSAACTGCDACLAVCAPGSLRRDGWPALAEIMAGMPVLLRAGALRRCERCSAKFAPQSESQYCVTCEWRESHPFGSRPPLRRPIAGEGDHA